MLSFRMAIRPGGASREFDEKLLIATADRINEVIDWHHREEQVLSHGDFHWDNLLRGENGNIVIQTGRGECRRGIRGHQLFSEPSWSRSNRDRAGEGSRAIYSGEADAHRKSSVKRGYAKAYACSQCYYLIPILAPIPA